MPDLPDLGRLVSSIQVDVKRSGLRVKNGIKHVAGINRTRVGTTPKDVIWSKRKAQLWRYRNDRITVPTPVVIVYSLVSRSYLLDLYPGHSVVERLRDEGFDVSLLDWGVADEEDAGLDLAHYVDCVGEAVEAAVAESGAEDAIVLGYCLGGTLAMLALASRPELPVRGWIAMATPVDFWEFGLFTELLGPHGRLTPDELIDGMGNVPPEAARDVFRVMKPTSRVSAYVNLYQHLWNDEFVDGYQAMSQWTRDQVPFPGRAFRDTVSLLFQDNAIVNDTARLRGQRVNFRDIRAPLLVVTAERDHIVPLVAATPITDVVGSDIETLQLPLGHVGLIVGRQAAGKTLPQILDWLHRHTGASADMEV